MELPAPIAFGMMFRPPTRRTVIRHTIIVPTMNDLERTYCVNVKPNTFFQPLAASLYIRLTRLSDLLDEYFVERRFTQLVLYKRHPALDYPVEQRVSLFLAGYVVA